jgi:hypothetical protein
MRPFGHRFAPIAVVAGAVAFAGCGNLTSVPTIDQVRTVPDGSQVKVLSQTQFEPKEGPIGSVLTVHGRGVVFPGGIARFQFSGTGAVEFDVPEATQTIRLRIPFGTISGPFGFTIAGRRSNTLENSLPSSNVFEAWRFEAPGFRVTQPTAIPENLLSPPPNQHPPPNG